MLSASSSPTNNLNTPLYAQYTHQHYCRKEIAQSETGTLKSGCPFYFFPPSYLSEIYPSGFSNFTFSFRNNAASQPPRSITAIKQERSYKNEPNLSNVSSGALRRRTIPISRVWNNPTRLRSVGLPMYNNGKTDPSGSLISAIPARRIDKYRNLEGARSRFRNNGYNAPDNVAGTNTAWNAKVVDNRRLRTPHNASRARNGPRRRNNGKRSIRAGRAQSARPLPAPIADILSTDA